MEIPIQNSKILDVLAINKFIDMISGLVVSNGYGEVTMKVTIKNGNIKIVLLNLAETFDIDSLKRKD